MNPIIDFLGKQWAFIIAIGTGLMVLLRTKSYIENNAVSRQEKAYLQDALNRIKENRDFKYDYEKKIHATDRVDLLSIMHSKGELRHTKD